MRPNRRLALRREVLTALGGHELRSVAGGQPETLGLCTTGTLASYRCPVSENPLFHCLPSSPATACC